MPAMSPAQLTYQLPAFYSRKTLHPPCYGRSHIQYTHISGDPSRSQSHGIMFLSCQEYQYRKALAVDTLIQEVLFTSNICSLYNGSLSQFQSISNLKCDKLVYTLISLLPIFVLFLAVFVLVLYGRHFQLDPIPLPAVPTSPCGTISFPQFHSQIVPSHQHGLKIHAEKCFLQGTVTQPCFDMPAV